MTEVAQKQVVETEARFVIHVPGRHGEPDYHLVKEKVHYDDGSTEPKLKWIKDFKRSWYVTSPQFRGHKQKKEVESFDKLMRYQTTQSEMNDIIARVLEHRGRASLRQLSNSPYLYGTEITAGTIIKKKYQLKNKTRITPFSVMDFDTETDTVNGTEDVIILTACMGNEAYLCVIEPFIRGIADPENYFIQARKKYLSDMVKDLDTYKFTFEIGKDPVDAIRKTFAWIHARKPDFLAIWNMDFDIPKIISVLEKYGVDPASVLCDPSVPPELRLCKYRQGLKKKRKANGQEVPIDVADQWHSLTLTASFFVIDAMCSYRLLRLSNPKEVSYSLDSILQKELKDQGVRKLNFKEADAYKKLRWHQFMQTNYKIEYMVYAIFDSISMKLLDEKTLDLCFKLPGMANCTSFARCNSKPKMIADALHFYVLDKGYVLNSVGETVESTAATTTIDPDTGKLIVLLGADGEAVEEGDPDVMALTDWIVTLPAHLVVAGLPLVLESDRVRTKLRGFVYDSDCVSAYPTCTSILNVSKSTTKREIVSIDIYTGKGDERIPIPESTFRRQNINLCSGYVNALEYGEQMFGLPNLFDLPSLVD